MCPCWNNGQTKGMMNRDTSKRMFGWTDRNQQKVDFVFRQTSIYLDGTCMQQGNDSSQVLKSNNNCDIKCRVI